MGRNICAPDIVSNLGDGSGTHLTKTVGVDPMPCPKPVMLYRPTG